MYDSLELSPLEDETIAFSQKFGTQLANNAASFLSQKNEYHKGRASSFTCKVLRQDLR
jgi:hypothetical protein